jgi:glycosyltransferase involved in cell wall biosynthesis
MRIAFVHPRYPSAEGTGATHSATQVVSGLAEAGHELCVYCPELPDNPPALDGVELRHLGGTSNLPHTQTRLNREVAARQAELREFDVVHSYTTPLLPSVAAVGDGADVATVITLNAYGGVCAKNDLRYFDRERCEDNSWLRCLRCTLQTSPGHDEFSTPYRAVSRAGNLRLIKRGERRLDAIDGFRAPSAHVRENYATLGYPREPIRVIPHPVDDRFDIDHTSDFAEPYRLLYVGSLDRHKGVETLVPLVAALADAGPEFSLTVIGSGGQESTMREQAQRHGVTDRVEFRGFVSYEELPPVYAAHDCFVYPGVWDEPLARVYLESLATGTPIVTSEYGSIADIVGAAGRLTDGSVDGFRETLLAVVDGDALPEMSAAAAEQTEQFRLDRVLDGIEQMYGEIVE